MLCIYRGVEEKTKKLQAKNEALSHQIRKDRQKHSETLVVLEFLLLKLGLKSCISVSVLGWN